MTSVRKLTDLVVKSIPGQAYRLDTPLVIGDFNEGRIFVVPRGFETDFASVPWFLRWLINTDAHDIRMAAVLHDYLYSAEGRHYCVGRYQADLLFYRAMRSSGARSTRAALAFLGVRLFGWAFYRRGHAHGS